MSKSSRFPIGAHVVHRDGSILSFASLADLADAAGPWLLDSIGASHHGQEGYIEITGTAGEGQRTVRVVREVCYTWIARTEFGQVITREEIVNARRADLKEPGYRSKRLEAIRHAGSLGLPIPRTGKRRGRRGRVLRHPRTLQEITANQNLADDRDELPVHVEQVCRRRYLPTCWDDIIRSDREHHSWKRHRRHCRKRR